MKTETIDLKELIRRLWEGVGEGDPSPVYAILDAASDEAIYSAIVRSEGLEYRCLYEAEDAFLLEDVAPYLIRLYYDSSFTEWFIENGIGRNWGILLRSYTVMDILLEHLRQFIVAKDEEEDKEMFFRFFDPRILRGYLPICTKEEIDFFFGPIDFFGIEFKRDKIKFFYC